MSPCIGQENCVELEEINKFVDEKIIKFLPIFAENWLEIEDYDQPIHSNFQRDPPLVTKL